MRRFFSRLSQQSILYRKFLYRWHADAVSQPFWLLLAQYPLWTR